MVNITIRAQRVQGRQDDIPNNQTNDGIVQPNIPRPQSLKVLVKVY